MKVCKMIQLQILSDAYAAANLWNSRLHLLWFTWLPFLGIIECSHWTPIRYLSTDKCAINLKCKCNWRGKCFKVIHNIINMYIWKYLEQADPMFVGVEEAVNVVQAGRCASSQNNNINNTIMMIGWSRNICNYDSDQVKPPTSLCLSPICPAGCGANGQCVKPGTCICQVGVFIKIKIQILLVWCW